MSQSSRILIVDNSRVVRASLAKHLQGRFTVREEGNGESAWQTLVLDSSIVAVISGAQMPKLDGYGLAERLRESRLPRLKEMPFFLIVSDTESEEGKAKARARGVSDFITKLMGRAEILEHLDRLVAGPAMEEKPDEAPSPEVGESTVLHGAGSLPEIPEAPAGKEALPVLQPEEKLLSAAEIEARLAESLAEADGRNTSVSVVVLGIGNYEALAAQFGQEMAKCIGGRFARLLLGKIGSDDYIGHLQPDRCLIVSRRASLASCDAFAERVSRSIANAQIAVRGQPVRMLICTGAAGISEDGGLSGEELLALAVSRMENARCCVGQAAAADAPKPGTQEELLPLAGGSASMLAEPPDIAESHLGMAGLKVLPLLRMLEREFAFGLPLPEMEIRLQERARLEARL